ncbi:MAG TPA: acyl-CoA dehydrogenase family protein [Candidatus Polarisedimenticolia bacterium]|nr:acyl-CoA dehydrogenase family protein [Candidatus Polarisedimenticolia bacterium]
MDFSLKEEQRMLADMVREFADREMSPVVASLERRGEFPAQIVSKLGQLGIMGMAIPEAYGGTGFDSLSTCLVMEEIARVCASTAVTLSVHNSAASAPIVRFGSQRQKEKYLPRMATGEMIGGFALTEPGCGSDAAALATRATRQGDRFILNGTKSWITNAHVGGVFVLMAVTNPEAGNRGISAFLVEPGMPGFSFGKDEDKMGLRSSTTGMISLVDCEVPAESLLGEEGMGLRIAFSTLDGGRIGIAAQSVGIARGAFEEARRYAQARHAFGHDLASFQAIRFMLADMAMEIDAARLLTHRAASLRDSAGKGGPAFSREASMAKLYASEMANRVAYRAVQIHGGYGYSKEYNVERYYRDARVTTIYEGTSEIQRTIIARSLIQ